MSASPAKKKGSSSGKSSPTGKAKKKVPPLAIISRGPAGVHEGRIKAELAVKEERCREHFENTSHLYKKSRNPCNGELTSREDAEFLIPIEHTIKKLSQQAAYSEYERTRTLSIQASGVAEYHSRAIKPNEMSRLETLKNQRQLIDNELKQLELVRGLHDVPIFSRPF